MDYAIVASAHANWIRLPSGTMMMLAHRPVRKRIVETLLHRLVSKPGQPLSSNDLAAAVWPGEPVFAKKNTLAVSLARLRADGLNEVLLWIEGGYLFNPTVSVEWVDDGTVASALPRMERMLPLAG